MEASYISSPAESLLESFKERFRNKAKIDYVPKPSIPGLIIGGIGIAASAMAAGRTSEMYSLAREAIPNLAESRREEIVLKPQSTLANKDKNKQNHYMRYGQLYKKYQRAMDYLKQRTSKAYAEIIDAVKKTKHGLYDSQPRNLTKQKYDTLKKSGLTGKVLEFSKYLKNIKEYPIVKKHNYETRSSIPYIKNQGLGCLEEKLAA